MIDPKLTVRRIEWGRYLVNGRYEVSRVTARSRSTVFGGELVDGPGWCWTDRETKAVSPLFKTKRDALHVLWTQLVAVAVDEQREALTAAVQAALRDGGDYEGAVEAVFAAYPTMTRDDAVDMVERISAAVQTTKGS